MTERRESKVLFEGDARGLARARTASRAVATSDVTRARDLAIAALVAAVSLPIALLLVPARAGGGVTSLRDPGPLARPHVAAKLTCDACHGEKAMAAGGPEKACGGCHGGAAHASTRGPHRNLVQRGQMTCTTCHPAHGGNDGVTFAGDGKWIRWTAAGDAREGTGAPAIARGTTVPLVPLATCGGCHDTSSSRDPIALCADRSRTWAVCLDEHQRVDRTTPAGGVCAKQHGADRFVAWQAAREIVRKDDAAPAATAKVAPERRIPPLLAWLGVPLAAATASLLVGRRLRRRRAAREAKNLARGAAGAVPLAPAERARLPVIDPTTCLGCYACVDACPFDVLEIQRYVAVVVRPADCCGVILCAQVCPNGSLQIDEGAPIATRPAVDDHLEAKDAPGVFLAGDLTGLPLIKNAIRQGVAVVDRIASLPRDGGAPYDVAIIGGGPAGIAAALRAREKKLRAVVLEQATVAASIKSFPRDKLVFDQPLDLPVEGELWLKESTKEELVAQWTRIVRARKLDIREGTRVTALERDARDRFVVACEGAEPIVAARVVLAIGRRGTPRLLDAKIDPERESSVSYALADARSFAGKKVLVVGLGDSAMEAAVAIARQPGTEVTVSYRGKDFARGKARNIAEVRAMMGKGRLKIVFDSVVAHVRRGEVELHVGDAGKPRRVANDAVLVLIGGVPSTDLVRAFGVRFGVEIESDPGP